MAPFLRSAAARKVRARQVLLKRARMPLPASGKRAAREGSCSHIGSRRMRPRTPARRRLHQEAGLGRHRRQHERPHQAPVGRKVARDSRGRAWRSAARRCRRRSRPSCSRQLGPLVVVGRRTGPCGAAPSLRAGLGKPARHPRWPVPEWTEWQASGSLPLRGGSTRLLTPQFTLAP